MIKCTDEEAKATEKVLDVGIYHDWTAIEWTYEYNSNYSSSGNLGSITLPTLTKKRATKLMCRVCGKTKEL